jgi:hypothetical protein
VGGEDGGGARGGGRRRAGGGLGHSRLGRGRTAVFL